MTSFFIVPLPAASCSLVFSCSSDMSGRMLGSTLPRHVKLRMSWLAVLVVTVDALCSTNGVQAFPWDRCAQMKFDRNLKLVERVVERFARPHEAAVT